MLFALRHLPYATCLCSICSVPSKQIPLRQLCEGLKLQTVSTYIQSGNVVFAVPVRTALDKLAARVEQAIEAECGFRPAVLLQTVEEMRTIVEHNPFPREAAQEPQKLVVTFLREPAPPAYLARVDEYRSVFPEQMAVRGLECYTYFPDGQGRTKLPLAALERGLCAPCTARNWNTVLKLLEMAQSAAG
ncbi:MAG: DUF1697 domain-containing protein [Acidobacteria bacterium]|nr:DUF1697 domain-containing protein [Acidobacteriota bacterium]